MGEAIFGGLETTVEARLRRGGKFRKNRREKRVNLSENYLNLFEFA